MAKKYMSQPSVCEFDNIAFPQIETRRLSNGVEVEVVRGATGGLFRIYFIFSGGLFDVRCHSVARLAMRGITEGCQGYSRDEVTELLDFNGVTIAKRVFPHYATVEVTVMARLLGDIIPILKSIIESPTYADDRFAVLKTNLAQSIVQASDRPKYITKINFDRECYGDDNPLGCADTEADAMSVARDEVVKYHRESIMGGGMALVIAGDVDDNVMSMLDKHFGGSQFLPLTGNAPLVKCRRTVTDKTVIVNRDNSVQSSIMMGFSIPGREFDDFKQIRIVNTMLGGYFGSRLMQTVRERDGLTYGISSQALSVDGVGRVIIASECNTAYTMRVIDAVKREIELLSLQPAPEQEIATLRSYLLSEYARMIDTAFDVADYVVTSHTIGIDKDYFDGQIAAVNDMTSESVMATARRYFDANNMLTVVTANESLINNL